MSELNYDVVQHALAESVFDIGWFPNRISAERLRSLSAAGFGAREVRVAGIGGRDDRYDTAQSFLRQLAQRCLLQMNAGFMLFRSLSRYGRRSRLRTHKGVFPGFSVASRDLVTEVECERDGESLIGGMLVVEEPWFEESWNGMADYQRAVVLLASAPLSAAPDRALVERVMGTLQGEEVVWIDYPRLVGSCADAGYGVLRRGGDAGESFVNLTLFSGPAMLKRFDRQVKMLRKGASFLLS